MPQLQRILYHRIIKKEKTVDNFKFIYEMTQDEQKTHLRNMVDNYEYKEEYNKVRKQKEKESFLKYLTNCKPFVKAENVPKLPVVEKEEWNTVYVPLLIEKGAILKEQLKNNVWYYGNFRNSNFGKWDAEKEQFGHWRMKFGWMWDTCDHFQDDEGFALFVPIREATEEEVQEQIAIENDLENRRKTWEQYHKENE